MKFGITGRLTLILAVLGIAVSGLTGFYAYSVSRDLLVQSAQGELMTATQVLAGRIALTRQEVSRNLQVLAGMPETLASLKDQPGPGRNTTDVAGNFKQIMKVNPAYYQIRLIAATDGGIEKVRVDREGDALLDITGDDLQEKGHFLYVSETLKLKAGQTYLSQIVINHEHGAHAGQDQPTVLLATPVMDAQGAAIGVMVINVDLNGTFGLLAADLPGEFQLYLANRHGDFLIHPDKSRAFGFDRGQRVLLQDEFAQAADLVAGKTDKLLVQTDANVFGNTPLLAAFAARTTAIASDENRLFLGLAQPLKTVLQQADQLGKGILRIVMAMCLVCIVLALLLARALTRPINTMNKAIHLFSNNNEVSQLPESRQDEIGMLARSFARMQTVITQQMNDLHDSREELEHLAQFDMLTDLPNRRMFMDRLEQTLALAKRNETGFALLFVDVDSFKGFNDRMGHAAGDTVLCTVAERLRHSIRAVDTAARLGGDEFVIILDRASHRDQISAFTEKLLAALKVPIQHEGKSLHVEFSIGIGQYPDDGQDSKQVIASADRAMYRTKAGGRNGYRFAADPNTQPSLL